MFGKKILIHSLKPAKGQGVIEYAGALVIASTIVAASLIIVPPNFAGLFNTICEAMSAFFSGQLPA